MSFNVVDQYNSFVENNFIKTSKEQLNVLKKLNSIWINSKKNNFFIKSKKKMEFIYMGQLVQGKLFY